MLTRYSNSESTGESAGTNVLTGALIIASGLLLYATLAVPGATQARQTVSAAPAVEQVVVTAPHHVS